ncbi:MAG TPA: outer membrane protein assembly factor BamD [Vicinamibacterales bacterium]
MQYLSSSRWRCAWRVGAALVVSLTAAACGASRSAVPSDGAQPDRFLFDRGQESMKEEEWVNAREYFRQVVDNYPQSSFRPDSKLGVGDSYLGEGSAESLVLAAQEFREFLTFYPTNPRADYAQYKLAMSHYEQMRAPERDQTETREALKEFDVFFQRFPNSPLAPEVKQRWREARDRFSQASYLVGLHYYRVRWYPGAIDRFREVLRDDPGFSGRDRIYFYLADSLARTDKKAEAIPYFERLLAEFPKSEHRDDTLERLGTLKTQ